MNKKIISVKKILAALVAMVMIMAVVPVAFAASTIQITDCQVIEDKVIVSASLDQVSNREHVIAIVTTENDEATYDNAVAFQYYNTSGTSFDIEILMPDELKTGVYKVTVGAPGVSVPASVNFDYMGAADRAAILDNINSPDADANTVVSAFDRSPIALDASGSHNAYYKVLSTSAKRQVAQYIIDNREAGDLDESGELELSEIGNLANEGIFITYFDNDTISKEAANIGFTDMLTDFAQYEYVDFDLSDSRYKKISNAVEFFRIVRAQPEYAPNFESIEICIDSALTLERINEAGWLEVAEVISSLRRDLPDEVMDEITVSKLREITENSTMKNYFGKSIKADGSEYKNVADEEKLPASTFDQLLKVWNRAYKDAADKYDEYLDNKNKEDKKPSGGSSGSSGSGKVTSNVTINQDAVRPDPLGQKKLVSDYYDDMADYEWAAIAVLDLTEKGIVNGNGNKKFNPAGTLKREEFIKMLVNTFNMVDMTATCSFSDCDKNAWYYVYVASAEKAGITNGRGDGTFGVGDFVTREEMAAMIYRVARSRGVNIYGSGKNNVFPDMNAVSAYAVEAVNALAENGIMDGVNGKFDPQVGATRAQAAVAIYNISNLYNK